MKGFAALLDQLVYTRSRNAKLQLIGHYFAEDRLLNVAHRYQQVTDWHRRAPAAFA